MYKDKYLKYKKKYIELKRNLKKKSDIVGSGTLMSILYRYDFNDFVRWYNMKTNPEQQNPMNSFQVLVDLFNERTQDEVISVEKPSILVGATNNNDNDYMRFRNSPTYSIFIDNELKQFNAEKQYNMYTIDYDSMINEQAGQELYTMLPPESIANIHFDTGVAYFCSLKYLEIASYLLVQGGKIVWNLEQHRSNLYRYSNNKFISFTDNSYITKERLEEQFDVNIDTDNKILTIKPEGFVTRGLSPQADIGILYMNMSMSSGDNIVRFKLLISDDFVNFCEIHYPQLSFEKKMYSFANYTYPVPIRITNEQNLNVNVFANVINFVVNDVMNLEERRNWINTGRMSVEKIIQLSNRIYTMKNLLNYMLDRNRELIPHNVIENIGVANIDNEFIANYLNDKFNEEHEWIEATKR